MRKQTVIQFSLTLITIGILASCATPENRAANAPTPYAVSRGGRNVPNPYPQYQPGAAKPPAGNQVQPGTASTPAPSAVTHGSPTPSTASNASGSPSSRAVSTEVAGPNSLRSQLINLLWGKQENSVKGEYDAEICQVAQGFIEKSAQAGTLGHDGLGERYSEIGGGDGEIVAYASSLEECWSEWKKSLGHKAIMEKPHSRYCYTATKINTSFGVLYWCIGLFGAQKRS